MEIKPTKKRSVYSLQITPAGLLFSIMVMLVAVLALSSGNNLLYLLVAVLIAAGVFSLFASRLILGRLAISLRSPNRIRAGEPVIFDLAIENRRRLFPVFSLTISLIEQPPGAQRMVIVDHAYLPILPRRTEARVHLERRFNHRGRHRFVACRIETRFPFGFFDHRRRIPIAGELLVQPLGRPWRDYPDLLPLTSGPDQSRRKGSGGDIYSIRHSIPTDHHQRIDWKATARTGQMMVREYTRDDDWRVTIILNLDQSMCDDDGYEPAIELAASLVDHLSESGALVEVIAPDRKVPSGSGERHRQEILDLLARLPVRPWRTEKGEGRWTRQWLRWRARLWPGAEALHSSPASLARDWYADQIRRQRDELIILIAPSSAWFPPVQPGSRIHFIAGESLLDRQTTVSPERSPRDL